MPDETMPPGAPAICGAGATLTDSEIVAAIRALSLNGSSGPIDYIDVAVVCPFAKEHPGDHAGPVQLGDSRPGRAWLLWGAGRRMERLADCTEDGCELYQDHPGRSGKVIAWPAFDHVAYGVDVTWIGDEGGMAARYHIPDLRFLAACNHLGRSEGLRNATDEPLDTVADWLLNVRRVWAVPVAPNGPWRDEPGSWFVDWTVPEGTPGAISMTVWEP